MSLSQSKFNAAYQGLSGIARKVYDATPISVGWPARDIHKEMWRTAGGNGGSDYRVVIGCLGGTLVDSGLVVEPQRGHFMKTPIREKSEKFKPQVDQPTPQEHPLTVTAIKPQSAATDPIDRLTKLSSRVTAMASSLKELAADIDAAALEIASQIERSNADTADLMQLRALLKKFG